MAVLPGPSAGLVRRAGAPIMDTTRLSIEDLEASFVELKPPMSGREASLEANRCLYCFDAPCIAACPTSIDVPTFIRKIATGNDTGAAVTILESQPDGRLVQPRMPGRRALRRGLCAGQRPPTDRDRPAPAPRHGPPLRQPDHALRTRPEHRQEGGRSRSRTCRADLRRRTRQARLPGGGIREESAPRGPLHTMGSWSCANRSG